MAKDPASPWSDEGRSNLWTAATDPSNTSEELTALRHKTAGVLSRGLVDLGNRLWVAGAENRDFRTVGIAMITQMAGELTESAVASFASGRWYAGNAAVRQLLEDHYLLVHFARDPANAERWATASRRTVDREFKPRQMRDAGGFDAQDYAAHCIWGGHPNPAAAWLLPGRISKLPLALLWVDLIQHLSDIITALLRCMTQVAVASDVAQAHEELVLGMARLLDLWRTGDPLSARPGMLLKESDPVLPHTTATERDTPTE